MKKDYRKIKIGMDTDTTCIPERLKDKVKSFNYNYATKEAFCGEFTGFWDGLQFNQLNVFVFKDDLLTFKKINEKYIIA